MRTNRAERRMEMLDRVFDKPGKTETDAADALANAEREAADARREAGLAKREAEAARK
jgi:hypothetical protein